MDSRVGRIAYSQSAAKLAESLMLIKLRPAKRDTKSTNKLKMAETGSLNIDPKDIYGRVTLKIKSRRRPGQMAGYMHTDNPRSFFV
jgi:hypothetical protein